MILLIITSKEDRAILDNMIDKVKPFIVPLLESAASDGIMSHINEDSSLKTSGKELLSYISKLLSK